MDERRQDVLSELESLLGSSGIAMLSLDSRFRLRRVTAPLRSLLGVGESDVGRPFAELARRLDDPGFLADAGEVMRRLVPREAEVQSVDGRWHLRQVRPVLGGDGRAVGVVATFTDISERKRREEHREILIAELQHRIKNLLTKVQAIIRLSRSTNSTVEDYSRSLMNRLAAIARTEDLISGQLEGTSLRDLVDSELASVSTEVRAEVEGPDVQLSPSTAQIFALALHELSTNAVKYGALGRAGGSLRIEWQVEPGEIDPRLSFRWAESGVPIAEAPQSSFGCRLIRDMVPQMLGGSAEWEATPDGVHCRVGVPLSEGVRLSEGAPDG